jgi:hypothetical protein
MPLASELWLVEDDAKSANVRTFGRLLLLPLLLLILANVDVASSDIIISVREVAATTDW